ncbi:helix-turn-helix domain-containing protein [Paenibacillus macerans]|uniref:helix-turn-helix domain-containing protein n=1 Tax=Paenibacillus macerans TaxID=44252 RepID=UPI003D31773F
MSQINEYSGKEKLAILKELKTGQGSLSEIAYKYSINVSTLKDWRRRYDGAEGLEFRSKNRSYSVELKLQAVQDYLSGKYSQHEVKRKYSIASRTQLRNWIKKYNSHSGLRPYKNGGVAAMTKGRTTTWEERIDIVLHCLANNRDYQKTVSQYQVSYQQVYQWVKKYEDGGQDALQDGRGRTKAPEELTEADQQKLAMKKLEYENERLRAENALLKKLQEFERRRR